MTTPTEAILEVPMLVEMHPYILEMTFFCYFFNSLGVGKYNVCELAEWYIVPAFMMNA